MTLYCIYIIHHPASTLCYQNFYIGVSVVPLQLLLQPIRVCDSCLSYSMCSPIETFYPYLVLWLQNHISLVVSKKHLADEWMFIKQLDIMRCNWFPYSRQLVEWEKFIGWNIVVFAVFKVIQLHDNYGILREVNFDGCRFFKYLIENISMDGQCSLPNTVLA